MDVLQDLMKIIDENGGEATIDEICTQYGIKHSLVVDSTVKNEITALLRKSKNIVIFDDLTKKCKKVGKSIADKSNGKDNVTKLKNGTNQILVNLIEQYKESSYYDDSVKRHVTAENLRAGFLKQFPMESIMSLSKDQYLISSADGVGKTDSFCCQIRYNLQPICHMGNVFFDVFGYFYNKGSIESLSKTYKKIFLNDFSGAFEMIKRDINTLLKAAEKDDRKVILDCKLNNSFKSKLLSVYFPDKYLPVCSKPLANEYCRRFGISMGKKDAEVIDCMIALNQYRLNNDEFVDWSNHEVMLFCNYLIEKDLTLSE